MKHLKTFEELSPSTYRNLRNRTADYPWYKYSGANTDADKSRADKMGRINQLSKERFEQEFYKQFPKDTTTIKVYDSLNPKNIVELLFNEIQWRANWTYYDLDFKNDNSPFYGGNYDVHIRFHGDTTMSSGDDAYTLERGDRLGFKGEIIVDKNSQQLLNSMFLFGKDVTKPEPIEEPKVEEKPKGFISKIKDFMK
jgi:hypothetical protein